MHFVKLCTLYWPNPILFALYAATVAPDHKEVRTVYAQANPQGPSSLDRPWKPTRKLDFKIKAASIR